MTEAEFAKILKEEGLTDEDFIKKMWDIGDHTIKVATERQIREKCEDFRWYWEQT